MSRAFDLFAVGGDRWYPGHGVDVLDPPTETFAIAHDARRARAEPAALLGGEILAGRFQILTGLGRGGMGQVYEAFDHALEQTVALKVVRPELARRSGVVDRFKHEVRLARRVSNEHVCRIFDLEQHHDPESPQSPPLWFLTMERVHGRTLASYLGEKGRSSPEEALAWLRQIAIALDAAHRSGVVHGDLKPSNVMLAAAAEGPRIVVTDFGLALAMGAPSPPSFAIEATGGLPDGPEPGELAERRGLGTPAYLAPEQWQGAPASVGTDLYAFGVIAHELLTGGRPPRGGDGDPHDLLHELGGYWPAEIISVIRSCLARDPTQRPHSTRELLERLASPEELRARLVRSRRRRRLLLMVTVILLMAVVAVGALAFRVSREASRARDMARLSRAIEWMDEDPTLAALTLLEVESPTPAVRARMRQTLGQPLAHRQIHFPSPVGQVAVGPGGRRVAAAVKDGGLYLWTAPGPDQDEGEIRVLARQPPQVTWLRFHATGRWLLAASLDGSVRVWDLETGTEPWVFAGSRRRLWRASFDPTGRRVVTPSEDGTAIIWSLDGSPPVVLEGHRHWVIDARFDAEGRRVVTASRDGTVRVWDAASGEVSKILEGHESWVFYAEFSPDGERVVSASRDGTARLWDLRTGQAKILRGHTATVEWAFFRPDGEQILTSSQDGTVRTWSGDGEPERIVERWRTAAQGFYVGNGRSILFLSRPELRIIPGDGQGVWQRFATLGGISALGPSPDGLWLATALEADVRLWPTRPERWSQVIARVGSSFGVVTADAGSRRLAVGTTEGSIHLVDPEGRGVEILEGHEGAVRGLAFRPDGRQLASASRDDTVRLWSLDGSHPPIVLRGHEGTVSHVVYHPDGDWLVSAGFDRSIRFWRTGPGEPPGKERQILAWQIAHQMVHGLDLGQDGRVLAVSSPGDGLQLFALAEDFRADPELDLLVEDPRVFRCLDFAPSGRWLSAIIDRSTLVVWDVSRVLDRRWSPVATLEVGQTKASCGGFDTVMERLVIPSQDGSVWVVDPFSEAGPIELLGHGHEANNAIFLDPHQVVSTSFDGTLRRWRVDDRDPRAALAQQVRICLEPETRQRVLLENEPEARHRAHQCQRQLAAGTR